MVSAFVPANGTTLKLDYKNPVDAIDRGVGDGEGETSEAE